MGSDKPVDSPDSAATATDMDDVSVISDARNVGQIIRILMRYVDEDNPEHVDRELLECFQRLEKELKVAAGADLFQIEGLCMQGVEVQMELSDDAAVEGYRAALAYIRDVMSEDRRGQKPVSDERIGHSREQVRREIRPVFLEDVFRDGCGGSGPC
ncbi:MAG: hypothetical protein WC269_00495 [Candidatus Gracilibacteria bacterium]|jgi:hypothetical protein